MKCRESDQLTTHVLVVDGNHETVNALCGALAAYGYGVYAAESEEAAVDVLKERAVDLVLCELNLACASPIGFTYKLCRMHPEAPIVLMVEFGDRELIGNALEAGASDFVMKPLDTATLPFVLENNLQRKRLEMRRLHDQRGDILLKTIKAMAAAIDAKPECVGERGHSMAEMCLRIGAELGLAQESLNTLELAAYIHDIGKIRTPDSVLTKPGKLTDEEWADILKHPIVGADYIAGIDELSEVASVVRHHHEHFDGSGYPDGLKGEGISLLARIIAVADAFEAMTSDRPYRGAMTLRQAIKELRANAGTQFDRQVTEAAVRAVESGLGDSFAERAA